MNLEAQMLSRGTWLWRENRAILYFAPRMVVQLILSLTSSQKIDIFCEESNQGAAASCWSTSLSCRSESPCHDSVTSSRCNSLFHGTMSCCMHGRGTVKSGGQIQSSMVVAMKTITILIHLVSNRYTSQHSEHHLIVDLHSPIARSSPLS